MPAPACATSDARATQVCLDTLESGGNAFDAAVAAAAMLAVVDPQAAGLGGGSFWLLHRARDDRDVFIDGREQAPAVIDATSPPRFAGAIPGTPAALARVASVYTSRPLTRLLQPAIQTARTGSPVSPALAAALTATPPSSWAARKLLQPGGRSLTAGQGLTQADLAMTLEALARDGRRGFYEGAVADHLLKAVSVAGGQWRDADLRLYRAAEREVVDVDYRGYRLTLPALPSTGGVSVGLLFGQLEVGDWLDDGSSRAATQWQAAWRRARAEADALGDPDARRPPLVDLLSRAHLRALAAGATPPAAPMLRHDLSGASVVVLDRAGNQVAATFTLGHAFGSGFLVPATGVFINDALADFAPATASGTANRLAAQRRPLSPMTPLFAAGPRGLLVTGVAGGAMPGADAAQLVDDWLNGRATSPAAALIDWNPATRSVRAQDAAAR
nr:gamma-glutamyltransferase [Solimonas marina]